MLYGTTLSTGSSFGADGCKGSSRALGHSQCILPACAHCSKRSSISRLQDCICAGPSLASMRVHALSLKCSFLQFLASIHGFPAAARDSPLPLAKYRPPTHCVRRQPRPALSSPRHCPPSKSYSLTIPNKPSRYSNPCCFHSLNAFLVCSVRGCVVAHAEFPHTHNFVLRRRARRSCCSRWQCLRRAQSSRWCRTLTRC